MTNGRIDGSGAKAGGSRQFAANAVSPFNAPATDATDRKAITTGRRNFIKSVALPVQSQHLHLVSVLFMAGFSLTRRMAAPAALVALMALGSPAHAGDFLSSLFGALSPRSAPQMRAMPYESEPASSGSADTGMKNIPSRAAAGGGAFCVRTCDGRYFAVPVSGGQSRAATCKSFCPASETKVFTGGNIDSAFSESGKSYSSLPNAFRYRTELVSGCTCNGKDGGGLAKIKIENDPTLRKGDIVAGPGGALLASRGGERRDIAENRGAGRPTPPTFSRLPVVAAQ